MRYYDLQVGAEGATTAPIHWGSYPNGTYDPGALNVIFDLTTTVEAEPAGASTIVVEGIDQKKITNATQYAGQNVTLRGGMRAGLPLANPAQAGLLIQGAVYQSYANWVGTQVDIAFVVLGSPYTERKRGNFILNWKSGTNLKDALRNTLQTAFPKAKININIKDDVRTFDVIHGSYTLGNLATMLAENTSTQVQISVHGNVINVFDDTYSPDAVRLGIADLIGQPAWIDQNKMQIRTVLRSDIQVGTAVQMPKQVTQPTFAQMTAAAMASSIPYGSSVNGKFMTTQVHHIGNLRSPNGADWSTIINAVPMPSTIAAS